MAGIIRKVKMGSYNGLLSPNTFGLSGSQNYLFAGSPFQLYMPTIPSFGLFGRFLYGPVSFNSISGFYKKSYGRSRKKRIIPFNYVEPLGWR